MSRKELKTWCASGYKLEITKGDNLNVYRSLNHALTHLDELCGFEKKPFRSDNHELIYFK